MIPLNWEAYRLLYPSHSAEDFARFLPEAELRMDVLTANRWRGVLDKDFRAARVRRCLAALVCLCVEGKESAAGTGVASTSNDGYSESYALVTAEQLQENQRIEAAKWLSGTGLVSVL